MRCPLENHILLQYPGVAPEIEEDFAPGIERAFSFTPQEQSYAVDQIEGDIPNFIRGTYYLNGPARFVRGRFRYRHWLDGDGMVCRLRFDTGPVHFANRFVRSEKLTVEEDAGQAIFRTFGTAFQSDRLKGGIALESPVNVSVYSYNGSLLAFGEQGLPWELDPVTLETHGKFTFGGNLNDLSPFAAHPKFDRTTGEMFNFGVAFSAKQPILNVYRFDDRGSQVYRKRLPLPFACSIHDFSLSPSYAIFYLSPYVLNMQALARDGCSLMDSLSWEPNRGSRLLVVARPSGQQIASIPLGRRYCLHLINSFEADGRLNVDVVEFERPIYDQYQVPNLFTDVCNGGPVRLVVDVEGQELIDRKEMAYRLAPDFPSIDPNQATQPYRDFWMLGISETGRHGRKFFDQLVHVNWTQAEPHDLYHAPPMHYFGGEPIFVGDPENPTRGVVICQLFDAEHVTSAFAIFDALAVASGPKAMIRLKAPIHLGFHAYFNPEGREADS
jgi:all-trans-8'-apo-beta-carotenal 15,15'-oxygenase